MSILHSFVSCAVCRENSFMSYVFPNFSVTLVVVSLGSERLETGLSSIKLVIYSIFPLVYDNFHEA